MTETEAGAIHEVILSLMKEVKRICETYDISYFLGYGSLLGAIRHEGFIPWDDDADILMLREDFEKFRICAADEIKPPFFLQTEENAPNLIYSGIMKVRRSDTTGVQQGIDVLKKVNHGIALDILALDRIAVSEKERAKALARTDRTILMQYIKANAGELSEVRSFHLDKRKTGWYKIIARCMPYAYLHKKAERIVREQRKLQNYSYYVMHNRLGAYRDICYEKEWFEDFEMYPFEDVFFPVPAGYDRILNALYGERYREIPPEKERKRRHSNIINPYVSYEVYLKHFTDIFQWPKTRRIIVFGAGHMLEYYLQHEGKRYRPVYAVDNDPDKWGKVTDYIEIREPRAIEKEKEGGYVVIICSIYYREIEKQLIEMGIRDYYFYIQNKRWL